MCMCTRTDHGPYAHMYTLHNNQGLGKLANEHTHVYDETGKLTYNTTTGRGPRLPPVLHALPC